MDIFITSLILAIVQGLTEWLPVSSSGHLVLFQHIIDYNPGLAFDVALHFGTLMAVFVYFGKDITDIIEAIMKGKWKSDNGKLGILLIIATIPAAVLGYVFQEAFESAFQSLGIVVIGFGITALVLLISSMNFKKDNKNIGYWDSFLIGCAQAVAIVPGISRSGSTISAGLLRGLDEKSAMRFSFLMSIPVIFGAGLLEIGNEKLNTDMIWATLISFIVGLLTIHFLLRFVSRDRRYLRWFAGYLIVLAIFLGIYLIIG